jgi:ribosomal protein S18 acetylase RimI-like enzyme
MDHEWVFSAGAVDWQQLADLYRIAPLGQRAPADLEVCFSNSRYVCFVYDGGRLIGAGRALADGLDCSYIADIAVHPDYQGTGIGKRIVARLIELSAGHRKIILYAAPGKEDFYRKLGFRRMTTAMALFDDQDAAVSRGVLENSEQVQLPCHP